MLTANKAFWDIVGADHTVYATDRVNGGVYILQPDRALAERMYDATLDEAIPTEADREEAA